MKIILFALVFGLSPLASLFAQEATIRVSSVVHADGTQTHTTTDLEARTSEVKKVDAAGKVLARSVYKLDDAGLQVEGTHYSAKDVPLYRSVFTRDPQGRISEEKKETLDGKLLQRLVYRFSPSGKVAGIDTYDAQGNLVKGTGGGSGGGRKQQPARRTR